MLVYNDQKEYVLKRLEEVYSSFIPEDNFWRRVNKKVDFSFVEEFYGEKFLQESVRLFKSVMLETYYGISDEELIERVKTDMVFRYFLGYELTEIELLDGEMLENFKREIVVDGFEEKLGEIIEKATDGKISKAVFVEGLCDKSMQEVGARFLLCLKDTLE